jgi:hypothetical protein
VYDSRHVYLQLAFRKCCLDSAYGPDVLGVILCVEAREVRNANATRGIDLKTHMYKNEGHLASSMTRLLEARYGERLVEGIETKDFASGSLRYDKNVQTNELQLLTEY